MSKSSDRFLTIFTANSVFVSVILYIYICLARIPSSDTALQTIFVSDCQSQPCNHILGNKFVGFLQDLASREKLIARQGFSRSDSSSFFDRFLPNFIKDLVFVHVILYHRFSFRKLVC